MESKELKSEFGKLAKGNGFSTAFGGWYRESDECFAVLELVKSKYSNRFMLLIKVMIKGAFNVVRYLPTKELMKSSLGDVTFSESEEFVPALDLESPLAPDERKAMLERLFQERIVPLVEESSTKHGIIRMGTERRADLLPAVKKELERLTGLTFQPPE